MAARGPYAVDRSSHMIARSSDKRILFFAPAHRRNTHISINNTHCLDIPMLPATCKSPHLAALASIVAQNTDQDGISPTCIPRVALVRFSSATQPLQTVQRPSLCIVVQGAKQMMLADEIYTYGPARHLVVSVDLPVTNQIIEASPEKPYLCICIDLDLQALGEMFMEIRNLTPRPRAPAARASASRKARRNSWNPRSG
jgi:hypothetical protein